LNVPSTNPPSAMSKESASFRISPLVSATPHHDFHNLHPRSSPFPFTPNAVIQGQSAPSSINRVLLQSKLQNEIKIGESSFSTTERVLVRHLTNVEREPNWPALQKLDLSGEGIDSLLLLDRYCCNLQELNMSNNLLNHLLGLPADLKVLNLTANR
jgi:hypothetical protein